MGEQNQERNKNGLTGQRLHELFGQTQHRNVNWDNLAANTQAQYRLWADLINDELKPTSGVTLSQLSYWDTVIEVIEWAQEMTGEASPMGVNLRLVKAEIEAQVGGANE